MQANWLDEHDGDSSNKVPAPSEAKVGK